MSFKKNTLSICVCLFISSAMVGIFHATHLILTARDSRGYDYNPIRNQGYDWTGPQNGEIINLNSLKNEKLESLSEKFSQQLILLTVVDPECGACQMSTDQMNYLQEKIKNEDCRYAIISFSQKLSSRELSDYLEKYNISTDSFIWTGEREEILPSINKMVLPTHILVDNQGRVIKTFPGTDKSESIRQRMTNQILTELSTEEK